MKKRNYVKFNFRKSQFYIKVILVVKLMTVSNNPFKFLFPRCNLISKILPRLLLAFSKLTCIWPEWGHSPTPCRRGVAGRQRTHRGSSGWSWPGNPAPNTSGNPARVTQMSWRYIHGAMVDEARFKGFFCRCNRTYIQDLELCYLFSRTKNLDLKV